MKKTIIIAEDHAFTARGMTEALEKHSDFDVIAVASNGIEAVSLIKKHQPDCALLDFSMPGANGLEVFTEAQRWSPKTRVALITGFPSAPIFQKLIDAGINGIFLKTAPIEKICQNLEQIAAGQTIISEEIKQLLEENNNISDLTPRELEVLYGIARGFSNSKIAEQLGVSPKTVDSHRTSLMRKLDVNSVAALLVKTMKQGLLDI